MIPPLLISPMLTLIYFSLTTNSPKPIETLPINPLLSPINYATLPYLSLEQTPNPPSLLFRFSLPKTLLLDITTFSTHSPPHYILPLPHFSTLHANTASIPSVLTSTYMAIAAHTAPSPHSHPSAPPTLHRLQQLICYCLCLHCNHPKPAVIVNAHTCVAPIFEQNVQEQTSTSSFPYHSHLYCPNQC